MKPGNGLPDFANAHPGYTLSYTLSLMRDRAVPEAVFTLYPWIMTIDDIIADFALLDDWDDRYRYLIELGRGLKPMPEGAKNACTKVAGCASQVWLATEVRPNGNGPVLIFVGESDAHIVRGLIRVLLELYSGKTAPDILKTDAVALFERLGLREHLTPQRSNGFRAMVARIQSDAKNAMSEVA